MPHTRPFESNNLHQEVTYLGVAKDNFDRFRENIYINNMEKISYEIDTIGRFLDLSATRRRQAESRKVKEVNFFDNPEEAHLLEQMRVHCPHMFVYHQNSYTFHIDDLKTLEDRLHTHVTNDCNARQTQLQTMFAQERFQSQAMLECMASIQKRCLHSMERIIANFAHR